MTLSITTQPLLTMSRQPPGLPPEISALIHSLPYRHARALVQRLLDGRLPPREYSCRGHTGVGEWVARFQWPTSQFFRIRLVEKRRSRVPRVPEVPPRALQEPASHLPLLWRKRVVAPLVLRSSREGCASVTAGAPWRALCLLRTHLARALSQSFVWCFVQGFCRSSSNPNPYILLARIVHQTVWRGGENGNFSGPEGEFTCCLSGWNRIEISSGLNIDFGTEKAPLSALAVASFVLYAG
jgi:hypothetical protein